MNVDALMRVLQLLKMPCRDQALMRSLLTDLKVQINTRHGLTDRFELPLGAPQGSSESPIAYAWLIEPILRLLTRMAKEEGTGIRVATGDGLSATDIAVGILAFADDLALVSHTVEGMQRQLDALHRFYTWARLKMNVDENKIDKTACLVFNVTETVDLRWGQPGSDRSTQPRIPMIQRGENYRYLGSRVGICGWEGQAEHLLQAVTNAQAMVSTARLTQSQAAMIVKTYLQSVSKFSLEFSPLSMDQCAVIDKLLRSAMRSSIYDESSMWLPSAAFHMCPSMMDSFGIRHTCHVQEHLAASQLISDLNSTNDCAVKISSRDCIQHLLATGIKGAPQTFGWQTALQVLEDYDLTLYNPSKEECPFAQQLPIAILRGNGPHALSFSTANALVNNGFLTLNSVYSENDRRIYKRGYFKTRAPSVSDEAYDELCRAWLPPPNSEGRLRRTSLALEPASERVDVGRAKVLTTSSCNMCEEQIDSAASRYNSPANKGVVMCRSCFCGGSPQLLRNDYPDLQEVTTVGPPTPAFRAVNISQMFNGEGCSTGLNKTYKLSSNELEGVKTKADTTGYLIWSIAATSPLYNHDWIRPGMYIRSPRAGARGGGMLDTGEIKADLINYLGARFKPVTISDNSRQETFLTAQAQRKSDLDCREREGQLEPLPLAQCRGKPVLVYTDGSEDSGEASSAAIVYHVKCDLGDGEALWKLQMNAEDAPSTKQSPLGQKGRRVLGAQTNNRGELQAICDAFALCRDAPWMMIGSDSTYAMDCIFQPDHDDDPKSANRDLINMGRARLFERRQSGFETSCAHTPSHSDNTDPGNDAADKLAKSSRRLKLPRCPALHLQTGYHLIYKGVPLNGVRALGKHFSFIQSKKALEKADGRMAVIKAPLIDTDLTMKLNRSSKWDDKTRNHARALRFTGLADVKFLRQTRKCTCSHVGCNLNLPIASESTADAFFDPVAHIYKCRSEKAVQIQTFIRSSCDSLNQTFGVTVKHVDFLHQGPRKDRTVADLQTIYVDYIRGLVGKETNVVLARMEQDDKDFIRLLADHMADVVNMSWEQAVTPYRNARRDARVLQASPQQKEALNAAFAEELANVEALNVAELQDDGLD